MHAALRLLIASLSLGFLLLGCSQRIGFGTDDDDEDDDDSADDDDVTQDDDDATQDDDDATPDDDDATQDDDDATQDDDDASGSFEVLSITPDDGSAEGGYTAEIFFFGDAGTDDEDDVDVYFGTRAADVLALTDDKIVVTVPPGCSAGDVDVDVDVPSGEDSIDFEYQAWAQGLDGAVFGVYRNLVVDPNNGTFFESGNVELGFFEPIDSPPLTHLPALGTCASTVITPGSTNRTYYSMGASLSISAGQSVPVTLGPDLRYANASVPVSALPFSSGYSVYGASDPDGCPVQLDSVVQSAPMLTVTDPVLTDLNYTSCIDAGAGLHQVTWVPSGNPSDRIIFHVMADPTNPALGQMICHWQDTGSRVLALADMATLFGNSFHAANFSRYRLQETTLDRSGATVYGLFLDTITSQVYVEFDSGLCG